MRFFKVFKVFSLFSFIVSFISITGIVFASVNLEEAINMADEAIKQIDMESNVDAELDKAITLLHAYNITKYDSVDTFMPYNNIRRDEAAKMYVNFQKNTLGITDLIVGKNCKFTDSYLGHSDLINLMSESCSRGLFNGHAGAFMPTEPITNTQAVIVLIRMIDGTKVEPNNDHYAINYMETAQNLGLLEGLDLDKKISRDISATRATVAKLLYRAELKEIQEK